MLAEQLSSMIESWLPLEVGAEVRVLDELRAERRENSEERYDAVLEVISSIGEKLQGSGTNIDAEVALLL
jgi:hypothetical protein